MLNRPSWYYNFLHSLEVQFWYILVFTIIRINLCLWVLTTNEYCRLSRRWPKNYIAGLRVPYILLFGVSCWSIFSYTLCIATKTNIFIVGDWGIIQWGSQGVGKKERKKDRKKERGNQTGEGLQAVPKLTF